jgi:hypothetical protein
MKHTGSKKSFSLKMNFSYFNLQAIVIRRLEDILYADKIPWDY